MEPAPGFGLVGWLVGTRSVRVGKKGMETWLGNMTSYMTYK